MSEPTTFKDVPEDVKTKARALAVTVLNMGEVEIATGFMAGVLLHTSNTLIEEQAARIAGLEDVLEEKRGNINSLRVRLSEAVKVLEPFARRCDESVYAYDSDDDGVTAKVRHLRAAKAFLSTLEDEE